MLGAVFDRDVCVQHYLSAKSVASQLHEANLRVAATIWTSNQALPMSLSVACICQ